MPNLLYEIWQMKLSAANFDVWHVEVKHKNTLSFLKTIRFCQTIALFKISFIIDTLYRALCIYLHIFSFMISYVSAFITCKYWYHGDHKTEYM